MLLILFPATSPSNVTFKLLLKCADATLLWVVNDVKEEWETFPSLSSRMQSSVATNVLQV